MLREWFAARCEWNYADSSCQVDPSSIQDPDYEAWRASSEVIEACVRLFAEEDDLTDILCPGATPYCEDVAHSRVFLRV